MFKKKYAIKFWTSKYYDLHKDIVINNNEQIILNKVQKAISRCASDLDSNELMILNEINEVTEKALNDNNKYIALTFEDIYNKLNNKNEYQLQDMKKILNKFKYCTIKNKKEVLNEEDYKLFKSAAKKMNAKEQFQFYYIKPLNKQ